MPEKSKSLSRLREPVNALTHLFAALAALGGLVALLVVGWGKLDKVAALSVYGLSLVLMFSSSAAYHMVKAQPKVIEALRKLDHSAIYALIAGTYTPFCFMFSGAWRWGMLVTIWSLAAIGITVKIFIIHAPRWLTAGVYLLMGWLCIIALPEMLIALPAAMIAWITAGGIIYTLGAVIYITRQLDFFPGKFGFHEVWHIFVILGALAHYVGILIYVAPA